MEIDPNPLPTDPAALRQMVVGLLEDRDRQEQRLRQLQHWLEQLLRAIAVSSKGYVPVLAVAPRE